MPYGSDYMIDNDTANTIYELITDKAYTIRELQKELNTFGICLNPQEIFFVLRIMRLQGFIGRVKYPYQEMRYTIISNL